MSDGLALTLLIVASAVVAIGGFVGGVRLVRRVRSEAESSRSADER